MRQKRHQSQTHWVKEHECYIKNFIAGMGTALNDPVNRGYAALWACVITGRLEADGMLRAVRCI